MLVLGLKKELKTAQVEVNRAKLSCPVPGNAKERGMLMPVEQSRVRPAEQRIASYKYSFTNLPGAKTWCLWP